MTARVNHLVSRTGGFAVTDRSAWFVWYQRGTDLGTNLGKRCISPHTLSIHRVFIKHVPIIYTAVLDDFGEPTKYLIKQAPLIVNALRAIGVPAWFCRIRMLSENGDTTVHSITVPQKYTWGAKGTKQPNNFTGVSACEVPDLVIKTVMQQDTYDTEKECLQLIADHYPKFHAYGSYSCNTKKGMCVHMSSWVRFCVQMPVLSSQWNILEKRELS